MASEEPHAEQEKLAQVDYSALDRVKLRMIEASKRTLGFAAEYGRVGNEELGASANIFSLNLQRYIEAGASEVHFSLIPEGLGTADDARPDDLTSAEAEEFFYNIAFKEMSALTNDAASSGLQTVAVGMYMPSSTPDTVFTEEFIEGYSNGIVDACREVGCVYLSGETPQLKGKIVEGKLDIAGSVVAVAPPGIQPVNSAELRAGDQIVFVESAGVHENGFTGFRELASTLPEGYRTMIGDIEYWRALNEPSKLYTAFVQALLNNGVRPTNIEPISGHGWQKLMRVGAPYEYLIQDTLPAHPIFEFIQKHSGATNEEMLKKFNMGVGQAIFVRDPLEAREVVSIAKACNLRAIVAGEVVTSETRRVIAEPYDVVLSGENST